MAMTMPTKTIMTPHATGVFGTGPNLPKAARGQLVQQKEVRKNITKDNLEHTKENTYLMKPMTMQTSHNCGVSFTVFTNLPRNSTIMNCHMCETKEKYY